MADNFGNFRYTRERLTGARHAAGATDFWHIPADIARDPRRRLEVLTELAGRNYKYHKDTEPDNSSECLKRWLVGLRSLPVDKMTPNLNKLWSVVFVGNLEVFVVNFLHLQTYIQRSNRLSNSGPCLASHTLLEASWNTRWDSSYDERSFSTRCTRHWRKCICGKEKYSDFHRRIAMCSWDVRTLPIKFDYQFETLDGKYIATFK